VQVLHAQTSSIRSSLEGQTLLTGQQVPFWMRSNQYGSVPISGASMSLIGRASKEYSVDSTRRRLFDWGAGFEGRVNFGSGSNFIPVEAYGKIRLAMLELKAGRSKDIMGLCDTLLSSGSFAVSSNALGIPKIQLSIPEFYTLPILGHWVAFKGNIAHGWLGEIPVQFGSKQTSPKTYYHQKSLYGRLKRPEGSYTYYGGFNHQVFWGSEQFIFESFTLTNWQSYQSVLYGKVWASSKVGNHLGSIDIGIEKDWKTRRLFIYRQQFYDVGALYYLANVADGLTGVSLKNKKVFRESKFQWNKITLEFLYTKNQAGLVQSRSTPSGAENYYNHYLYTEGWSYKGRGLGNPLISMAQEVRSGMPNSPKNFFINNRVMAFHLGFDANLRNYNLSFLGTYSKNFGTFKTSGLPYRTALLNVNGDFSPVRFSKFSPVGQLSTRFSFSKNLTKNNYWGGDIAFDLGSLYKSSFGLILKYGIKI
jgi:hypothetical protein